MFIRFVVDNLDPESGKRQGLFQAVETLRESGRLNAADANQVDAIEAWFGKHLPRPRRLAISSRAHGRKQALSWFRNTAHEHIARMRAFQSVIERSSTAVHMVRASRPGYVVYQDEFQVAAYPFQDTPT